MFGAISAAHSVIGIVFIGLGLCVFFYARQKARDQEPEPEVDRPPARPAVAPVEWFPKGVWGVEHGDILPDGDTRPMIYDWDRNRDVKPAYVGSGRGHAL